MHEVREYVENFAREHGMSLSALASALGYSSKTTLIRLMDQPVRQKSALSFMNRMKTAFALSDEEFRKLRTVMRIKRFGLETYTIFSLIDDYIHGRDAFPGEEDFFVTSYADGTVLNLNHLYENVRISRITLMNSIRVNIYHHLRRMLQSEQTRVSHYVLLPGTDPVTMQWMRVIQPVLFLEGYQAYSYQRSALLNPEPVGLRESDLMIIEYAENGEEKTDTIVFTGHSKGILIRHQMKYQQALTLLRLEDTEWTALKYDNSVHGNVDYFRIYRDLVQNEKDRGYYSIAPTVSMLYIPPDIMDGVIPSVSFSKDLQQALSQLHRERYANLIRKKTDTYIAFRYSSMRSFVLTGKMWDHPWPIRAFTKEERIRILKGMISQQETNPHVHFAFLRSDQNVREAEIVLLDGLFLEVVPEGTNYQMERDNLESRFTAPALMDYFKNYVVQQLFPFDCIPESETCSILEELISLCREG